MSERPQASESKTDREYWDNHFIKDGCSVDSSARPYPKFRLKDLSVRIFNTPRLVDLAFGEILDLIANGEQIANAFENENRFDVNDFREGTIIRFEQETLTPSFLARLITASDVYQSRTFYGFVGNLWIEGDLNNVLVCFRAVTGLDTPIIKTEDIRSGQMDLGTVIHFGGYALLRNLDLEVLKIGDGIPVLSQSRVPAIPSLSPSLT